MHVHVFNIKSPRPTKTCCISTAQPLPSTDLFPTPIQIRFLHIVQLYLLPILRDRPNSCPEISTAALNVQNIW